MDQSAVTLRSGDPMGRQMLFDGRADVVEMGLGHARIHPEPEGVVHQPVGVGQVPDLAEATACRPHLIEAGLTNKIAGEEHPSLNPGRFERFNQAVPGHGGARPYNYQEAEPARRRVRRRFRQSEDLAEPGEPLAEVVEVPSAGSHERGQLLQLCYTDCCLHVGHLEVVTEVGVSVLVVISCGQGSQRPGKPLPAGIGAPWLAVAVAAPVADRLGDAGQLLVARVDRAAFAGGHLVRWVETAR